VQAFVEAEMNDGTTRSARCEHPRGSAENPLSRAQVEKKFRTYAPARIGEDQIESILAAVDRLEDFGSVRDLMDDLRAPRRTERLKARA